MYHMAYFEDNTLTKHGIIHHYVIMNLNSVHSKHDTLTQRCFNVGPALQTVDRHGNNIGFMSREPPLITTMVC